MRRFAMMCCAATVVGCAKTENQPAKDTAAAPVTPQGSTRISLADVAGKWQMRSTDQDGTNATESVLTATADTSGWSMVRANRAPEPIRVVAVDGDSIVTETGPYESVLRKGIQVKNRTVYRLQNGKLVGSVEGHYATAAGDSASHRKSEGTRAP